MPKVATPHVTAWTRKIGHLRPWEVLEANREVQNLAAATLANVTAQVASQIEEATAQPLKHSDVELLFSYAADLSGVFQSVPGVEKILFNTDNKSLAWCLVVLALKGATYGQILDELDKTESRGPGAEMSSAEEQRRHETVEIVSAYVGKNSIRSGELPALIQSVHRVLSNIASEVGPTKEASQEPAVPVRRSITPDYLVCLEDGRKFKLLTRHLRTKFNMSPDEYRAKWNLPKNYPMAAPNYARARSELAKRMGLGQARQRPRVA